MRSGHCRNSDGWCLSYPIPWSIKTVNSVHPEFIMIHSYVFIYICQQIEKMGQPLPEWWWVVEVITHPCSDSGLDSSSGGELKLYLGCTGSTSSYDGTNHPTQETLQHDNFAGHLILTYHKKANEGKRGRYYFSIRRTFPTFFRYSLFSAS